MSIVDYLCIACAMKEQVNTNVTFQVDSEKSALQCPTCGSSAIIPKDKFIAAAQSSLNKPSLTEKMPFSFRVHANSLLDDQSRWDAPRVTDKGEGVSIRNFLKRNKLHYVEDWWDGFRSFVTWSFTDSVLEDEIPSETESEWFELKLTCRSGDSRVLRFYFNPEDEGMVDIGDVKRKGT